ncbi:orotate phosphoribosyltransferase [Candidatus Bathyarchaeota archaeon]|nr:orotate phosphoribosyltransferase [Candidatus Bathyarchaeota archaeon]
MSRKEELVRMKDDLIQVLVRTGAIKFGAFTLASGKLSPYYIDLRLIPSYPEAFRKILGFYASLAKTEIGLKNFDRIAGIPTAGIPFSAVLAFNLEKPFLYVRKEIKTHGRERRVEGLLMPGDRILLVDDLITTGTSLLGAADAVIAEGAVVKDALVLIDREEGGKQALSKLGIKLHYLLKISEAAKKLYEVGVVDQKQLKAILKQVK